VLDELNGERHSPSDLGRTLGLGNGSAGTSCVSRSSDSRTTPN
jgi:hypothetical protein